MAGVTGVNDQKENLIIRIRKRDGREVNFEPLKISDAIYKALVATGKPDFSLSEKLATKVVQKMIHHGYGSTEIPSVEDVQDMVESILIEEGLSETAKAYILYRHERRKLRDEKMKVLTDPEVRRRLREGAESPESGVFRGVANWGLMTVVETYSPENEGLAGRTIGEIATERKTRIISRAWRKQRNITPN